MTKNTENVLQHRCAYCNQEFIKKYSWHKYCSSKCRQAAFKLISIGGLGQIKDIDTRITNIEKKLGIK